MGIQIVTPEGGRFGTLFSASIRRRLINTPPYFF
jgi:hypothetical protein